MGFEPMMRVLQTLALPLGHVAVYKKGWEHMAPNQGHLLSAIHQ